MSEIGVCRSVTESESGSGVVWDVNESDVAQNESESTNGVSLSEIESASGAAWSEIASASDAVWDESGSESEIGSEGESANDAV